MTEYRFNPAWWANATFASGGGDLTASDLGVLVEILGRFGTMTSDDGRVGTVKALAEAPPETEGFSVEIAHDEARRVGAFRKISHALKGIERLRHVTVGDVPCFRAVDVTDARTRFHLAGGPAVTRSHWAFGKVIKRDADRSELRTYRQYVTLDADLVGRFKSSLSLPVLGRALAWIHANCATGLPEASAYRHDVDDDVFTFTLAPVEVPDAFGFRVARTRPNYLIPALDRIRGDLKRAGIMMRVTPRMAGGTIVMIGITLREIRAVDVDMSREDPHDVRYDGLPTQHFKRPTVADSVAPVSVSRPRGRMKGIEVAEPDVAEPIVTEPAPVVDAVAPPIDRRNLVIDHRPPWLRRRLRYKHPDLLEFWGDRPMDTLDGFLEACRIGLHVWIRGMGAQPHLIREDDALVTIKQISDLCNQASARLRWVEHRTNEPDEEWTPLPGGHVPGPEDDFEADLHPRTRTIPRDPHNELLRPHDGIGWVDDDGQPVDDDDQPMDRTADERAWDAMLA